MSLLQLASANGATIPTWLSVPEQEPVGAVMLLHEAFGLTPHMLEISQHYAKSGYVTLAPDLFARQRAQQIATGQPLPHLWKNRTENGAEVFSLPISKPGLQLARQYIGHTTRELNAQDAAASLTWLRQHYPQLPVAVVGHSFGGGVAYYLASHYTNTFLACVLYYAGLMAEMASHAQPSCSTLVHLAQQDRLINVQQAQAALATYHPSAQVYLYDADHGFDRTGGITYHGPSAQLAFQTTLQFLQTHCSVGVVSLAKRKQVG